MKRLSELSTGLAVTVAFFNVALLITELVKAVTDDGPELMAEEAAELGKESLELEENY